MVLGSVQYFNENQNFRWIYDTNNDNILITPVAGRCEYTIVYKGKGRQQSGVERFAGEPAGTWLTVKWKPGKASDVVELVRLMCYDVDGFSRGLEVCEPPMSADGRLC